MDQTRRKKILFWCYITIHIYICDNFQKSYSQNRKFWSLFGGVIFRKVFQILKFYANQLVFRVKQPYILSFIEIQVEVVRIRLFLGDLRENTPMSTLKSQILMLFGIQDCCCQKSHWSKYWNSQINSFLDMRLGQFVIALIFLGQKNFIIYISYIPLESERLENVVYMFHLNFFPNFLLGKITRICFRPFDM